MLEIGLKERVNHTLKTVPLGRSGWAPGGVPGVEPLPQPPKKNTEQPPALRSPYRTARKRPRVVTAPPYARGGSGAQMDPFLTGGVVARALWKSAHPRSGISRTDDLYFSEIRRFSECHFSEKYASGSCFLRACRFLMKMKFTTSTATRSHSPAATQFQPVPAASHFSHLLPKR